MQRIDPSETRRLLLWFFDRPSNDPYVSLTFDVVIEPALLFRDAYQREHGVKVGIQHLVTKAVARTLAELPALNVKIIGRRMYQLHDISLAVPVHLAAGSSGGDETGMALLQGADKLSLAEIATGTRRLADEERQGRMSLSGTAILRRAMRHVPDAILYPALDLASAGLNSATAHALLENTLSVSSGVTNVGSVVGMPKGVRFRAASATVPDKASHVASLFAVGPVEERAVVEDGAVVPRKVLPLILIADHRAIDGVLMGTAAAKVGDALARPALLA